MVKKKTVTKKAFYKKLSKVFIKNFKDRFFVVPYREDMMKYHPLDSLSDADINDVLTEIFYEFSAKNDFPKNDA